MKSSQEIRQEFLDFFADKQHKIVPSAPIIPQNDKTLYFTNAGMNQFKDVFLGTGSRNYKRAVDTQKCIRVSGKHNDLEEVGRDTYHHTFFEMLGNWSFGDYFKEEAISWAWQLLTEVWELPKERLWVTVFAGDSQDNLEADTEATRIWHEVAGVPKERILQFSKKDNFWEMGDTGPCGPCSEIHIDCGPDPENLELGKHPVDGVNGSNDRYIELWNLVFIEFNRREDGHLEPLPEKHVDTGMGFERLVAYLQHKKSNYETDLFTPILEALEKITGKKYGENRAETIAFQVIADHVRALSIAFADGALPGNSERGYVLRRILRRAARFGRQNLDMQEPFIYQLVPVVANIYEGVFPEIKERQDHIELLIKSEEKSFDKTLTRGVELFGQLAENVKKENGKQIPGDKAFELYQRDGFPKDLVELMAEEQGLVLDQKGWQEAEEQHRIHSSGQKFTDHLLPELEGLPPSRFLGYSKLDNQAKIVKLIDTDKIVLDRTTFYAESGGQIGDTGNITGKNFRFEVYDTQKEGDIFVHFGELVEGDLANIPKWVSTHVDKKRRKKIMANHTATHLLHWALRKTLGDHAAQQGSVVAPEKLRFDISHPEKIKEEELRQMEDMVNEVIYENIRVRRRVESLETAKEKGAMALFGEKYGEKVRVITIGLYSMELCGGTHALFTGNLGCFKIVSESAVQAGVRRIEAVTRDISVKQSQKNEQIIEQIKMQLKLADNEQLVARISSLQEEIKELRKKQKQEGQKDNKGKRDELLETAEDVNGTKVIVSKVDDIDPGKLRELTDLLRKCGEPTTGFLATIHKEKIFIVVFVGDLVLDTSGIHAGEILKDVCAVIGGGGNTKRKDFAQGQGKNISQLETVLSSVRETIKSKLTS